jgi:hypothetical protein
MTFITTVVAYIQRYHIAQYVSFIRFPVALALGLAVLPLAAPHYAPEMFDSLFALQWPSVAIVVFAACICFWAILYGLMVLWYAAPFRAGVDLSKRAATPNPEIPQTSGEVLVGRKPHVWVIVLVFPLACQLVTHADGGRGVAVSAALAGWLSAVVFREAVAWAVNRRSLQKFVDRPVAWIRKRIDNSTPATVAANKYNRMRTRAVLYGAACIVVYLGFGWWGQHDARERLWLPAILYLYLYALLATVILVGLSYQFDRYRTPVLTLFLMAVVCLKYTWPNDFTYATSAWNGPERMRVDAALHQFGALHDSDVVVVAASGGGITAALWTTVVLQALDSVRMPPSNNLDFRRHVAVVSSVSGGSVGAMYYVNGIDASGRNVSLDSVVDASHKSSLEAATWGMMYPDVLRIVHVPLFGHTDRGGAQEARWQASLGDTAPTFATWAKDVNAAARPIQIFNATIEETGERLLISPVKLSLDTGAINTDRIRQRRELLNEYPGRDINVVTAARLSATFPYVSPHPRADIDGPMRDSAFHVADGGYFDNSGIVTALETVLDWFLTERAKPAVRRVALIEIRAGGPIGVARAKGHPDPLRSIVGPFKTMFNVRSSAQVSRTAEEICLFKTWAHDSTTITFDHFVFRLGGDSPLSWHLTDADTRQIRANLKQQLATTDTAGLKPKVKGRLLVAREENRAELARLQQFFASPAVARVAEKQVAGAARPPDLCTNPR